MGLAGPSGLVNVEEEGRLRREEVETGLGSGRSLAGRVAGRQLGGEGRLETCQYQQPPFFSRQRVVNLPGDEAWS